MGVCWPLSANDASNAALPVQLADAQMRPAPVQLVETPVASFAVRVSGMLEAGTGLSRRKRKCLKRQYSENQCDTT